MKTSVLRQWVQLRPLRIGAALFGPLVTAAVLGSVRDHVTAATAALLLVLWVVAAAATGDRVAGVLAALSGAAWFDFFLAPPVGRFTIADPDNVEIAVLFVVIGIAVTELALWGYRQRAGAARRSGYLDGVVNTAQVVAEGETPPEVVTTLVARQIADILNVYTCDYVAGPVHDARIAILHRDGTLTRGGHNVNVERHGLPTDEFTAILIGRGESIVGHYLLNSATRLTYPNAEQRRVAVLLADQAATALAQKR